MGCRTPVIKHVPSEADIRNLLGCTNNSKLAFEKWLLGDNSESGGDIQNQIQNQKAIYAIYYNTDISKMDIMSMSIIFLSLD